MTKMGLAPIYQHPKTSEPHTRHKIYPYLLRHLTIEQPNQVWCADVTYIPMMRRGFLYLVVIMDWASRKVLAWQLSNTMDAEFCVAALEDAMARYGKPDIFNTDQGSQFTSFAFTNTLRDAGIRISMDGRGRWMDNVCIERLWRSLKYECVFLNAFETGSEARAGSDAGSDNRPMTVTHNGRAVRMHPHEATMRGLAKSALRGKLRAMKEFFCECKKAGLLDTLPARQTGGVLTAPKGVPTELAARLVRIAGPPPWDDELYDQCKAEYARDRQNIDRLEEKARRDENAK